MAPRWRRDGRELFYLTLDGSVMAVEVDTTREFRPSQAKRLFTVTGVIPEWGVTRDGARFLFAGTCDPTSPLQHRSRLAGSSSEVMCSPILLCHSGERCKVAVRVHAFLRLRPHRWAFSSPGPALIKARFLRNQAL